MTVLRGYIPGHGATVYFEHADMAQLENGTYLSKFHINGRTISSVFSAACECPRLECDLSALVHEGFDRDSIEVWNAGEWQKLADMK